MRNTGLVSRMKSVQNCPAACSGASGGGGGARSTRSSTKPSGSNRPAHDASAANTTVWPCCRQDVADPDAVVRRPVGALWHEQEGGHGYRSSVTPGASIELAARLLGRKCFVERPITVDQTNYSVVVDDAVVVKWLRPAVPVPHPGVQLIRHLAAAGFAEMPGLVGVDERDGVVHAIVTTYLPAALDGWDWYVDDVEQWLADAMPLADAVESASRMGAITARLHTALADMQPSTVEVASVVDQAMADLRLARSMTRRIGVARRSLVADCCNRCATQPVPAHRIHGDLHAGQFLRTGTTW